MFVIQRANRFGIRLKDKNSATRKAFSGLKYFPVQEQYRVEARFLPYDPPKKIAVPNILGDTEEEPSPGYVEFTLSGQKCRLDPVSAGDELFFIFRDLTSGKETYPSGRFLYTDMPKNGEVVLDFNKAVNPPCAFTPFATCPLPPKQNHLPIRIEAGELRYGHLKAGARSQRQGRIGSIPLETRHPAAEGRKQNRFPYTPSGRRLAPLRFALSKIIQPLCHSEECSDEESPFARGR